MLETEKRDIVWCCSKWKSALSDLGSLLFHVSTSSGPAGRSRDFSHSAPSIRRHTVDVDGDGGIARPRKEGPGLSLRQSPSPCRAVVCSQARLPTRNLQLQTCAVTQTTQLQSPRGRMSSVLRAADLHQGLDSENSSSPTELSRVCEGDARQARSKT